MQYPITASIGGATYLVGRCEGPLDERTMHLEHRPNHAMCSICPALIYVMLHKAIGKVRVARGRPASARRLLPAPLPERLCACGLVAYLPTVTLSLESFVLVALALIYLPWWAVWLAGQALAFLAT